MRISDLFLAFPGLVFALAVAAVLGGGIQNAIIALAVISWPKFARLARGLTLTQKASPYLMAAKLSGSSTGKLLIKHILPNIRSLLLVLYTMSIPVAILSEAGLSFLGFGAQPPQTSLGVMVSKGRTYLFDAPWISLAPAIYILLLSLCLNFFGDSLRDMLDSKCSER